MTKKKTNTNLVGSTARAWEWKEECARLMRAQANDAFIRRLNEENLTAAYNELAQLKGEKKTLEDQIKRYQAVILKLVEKL